MFQTKVHPCPSKVPRCSRSPFLSNACCEASRRPSLAVAFHSQALAEYIEPQASRSAASSNLSRENRLHREEGALAFTQQPLWQPEGAGLSSSAQPLAQLPAGDREDGDPNWLSSQQASEQHQAHQPLLYATATSSSSSGKSPANAAPHPAWFDAQKQAASLLTRKITACSTWQELEQLHQQHRHEMDFIHLCAMLNHLAHLIAHRDQGLVEKGDFKQATPAAWAASLKVQQQQHHADATSSPTVQVPHSGTHSSKGFTDTVWPRAPPAPRSPPAAHCSSNAPTQGATPWPTLEIPPSSPEPSPHTPAQTAEHASRLRPASPHHVPTPLYPPAPPPMHLARQLQQQLLAQQQLLRPREAANCLWALARLQMHFCEGLEGGVTELLLHPSMAHLAWRHARNMGFQELSSVLYSTARLGLRPPSGHLSSCLRRLGELCFSAQPQALANSVWALGKMGVAVPPNILRRLLQASYRDMYHFTPQGLVCLVYGFANMYPRPILPKAWQFKLLDASWRFMRPDIPDALGVMQAVGSKQQGVHGSVGGSLLHAVGSEQQGVQGSVGSSVLHAVGGDQQGVQGSVGSSVLHAVGDEQQGEQGSVGGSVLRAVAGEQQGGQRSVSLQHSTQQPGQAVLEGESSSSSSSSSSREAQTYENNNSRAWERADDVMGPRQRGPALHASTLIRLLRCLVQARAFPSKPWLAECFAQVEQQAHALNAVDVVNALWALGQMRRRPPVPHLALLMQKAYVHMAELPLEALVGVIWAAAQLGARPSVPWAERFLRLAFRSRDRMTPRMVANTLLSLARLHLRPNRRFVHGLLLPLRPLLVSTAGGADTVQLAMALPALKHGLPAEMVPEFQCLIDAKLPRLRNPVARGVACKGWASLGLRVEEPWRESEA